MKTGRKLVGGLVACVATLTVGAVMVLLPGAANAGPAPTPLALVVDTLVDNFDFDAADGLCDDGPDGDCSLREAVAVAAENAGGGTVTFGVDGTVVLETEIVLEAGSDVTITGNGVDKTIVTVEPPVKLFRGNGNEPRHFWVWQTDLTVEDLTLRDGLARRGGSIYVAWQGALTTENVHFLENEAQEGGAIFADAENDTLDVRSTTFAGNQAAVGGAIVVDNDTATVVNSTFTANEAIVGAAIWVHWQGTLDISWSTFSGNVLVEEEQEQVEPAAFQGIRSSSAAQRGVFGPGGDAAIVAEVPGKGDGMADVTISHSILEKTTGSNTGECSGPIVSGGANIVDDMSCGFVSALDLEGTPANVGPLQDNGGATFTMALAADSAAVDVDTALCKLNDQRDLPRNTDGDGDGTDACDSGAYELQEESDEPTTTSTTAPDGGVDADTATPARPTVARPTFTG